MVVLGYSRLLWVKFYPRKTMRVVMGGLEPREGRLDGRVRQEHRARGRPDAALAARQRRAPRRQRRLGAGLSHGELGHRAAGSRDLSRAHLAHAPRPLPLRVGRVL